jgi:menaquinone-dependent protoporphyrinogen oxidase
MKMLVCAASKHGSTEEIAHAIAMELELEGISADVLRPEEVESVEDYDGVILGSGVYAGHWLSVAMKFVEREAGALARRPVWLFSSGPLGDPPLPATEPVDVPALVSLTGAREHRVIPGRLEKSDLGFGERAIVKVVRAAEGDYRPWGEIAEWAKEIAAAVKAESGVTRLSPA